MYQNYGDNMNFEEAYYSRDYQSSVGGVLNFGVGKQSLIDSIVVVGPNNETQKLENISSNQTLAISFNNLNRDAISQRPSRNTIFTTQVLDNVTHVENEFNDFDIQSLLPNKLSRQGPCISVTDVNNDGFEDFFIDSAKDEAGQIYLQNRNGGFVLKHTEAF